MRSQVVLRPHTDSKGASTISPPDSMPAAGKRPHLEIVKRSLDIQAADKLRDAILAGHFQPGERLTEEALAASLLLSRGTVRAALRQLIHEGLIVQEAYKGYSVQTLSANDARELCTLRNVLEGFAARLVAERIDAGTTRRLDEAFDKLVRAVNEKARKCAVEADFDLHRTIIQSARHSKLEVHYGLIEQQMRLYQTLVSKFLSLQDYVRLHADLVDAMKRGNAHEAERIALQHNTADGELLVERLLEIERAQSAWARADVD